MTRMTRWTPLNVARDAWRTTREGPAGIAARQQARLFDDWVTDPAVTRAATAFVADAANVGADSLGRYVVFTTSEATGTPGDACARRNHPCPTPRAGGSVTSGRS